MLRNLLSDVCKIEANETLRTNEMAPAVLWYAPKPLQVNPNC